MGTILASEIIADASELLQDKSNVRWTKPAMLKWLDAGLREVVIGKPDAYVRNEAVKLAEGAKQALPAGGILLMDITRNMGATGTAPGRVPRFIERTKLDDQHPNWHADPASATVFHYTYDERDPTRFYVHPKQPAANQGYVELLFSATPPKLASEAESIPVDDVYANALTHYLVYRAYSRDGKTAAAREHYEQFVFLVTGKKQTDAETRASGVKEQ